MTDSQIGQNSLGINRKFWIFLLLAFGISWLLWAPTALAGQDVKSTPWVIPYVLGGFGPSVAGVILIARFYGKRGLRDLFARLLDFRRISAGWYGLIILIFPVIFGLSALIALAMGASMPGFEALRLVIANPLSLIGLVLAGILTGPLAEELGWRGFALDRLQERRTALVSSLVLGLFWWAWHLPLFFIKGTTQYNWGIGSVSFWLFLAGILPLSVLMTWVYNGNRRSVLAPVLLHFFYNFTLGLVYPFSEKIFLYQVILMAAVAIGVVLVDAGFSVRQIKHVDV